MKKELLDDLLKKFIQLANYPADRVDHIARGLVDGLRAVTFKHPTDNVPDYLRSMNPDYVAGHEVGSTWRKIALAITCAACGGTGVNSRGGECIPCRTIGRKPKRGDGVIYAAGFKDAGGVNEYFAGPWPEVAHLLDTKPPKDKQGREAYIVKITTTDGKKKTVPAARWRAGRWQLRKD